MSKTADAASGRPGPRRASGAEATCGISAARLFCDRAAMHAFVDRPGQDVFARRVDEASMVMVSLCERADVPEPAKVSEAADSLKFASASTRNSWRDWSDGSRVPVTWRVADGSGRGWT